MIVYSFVCLLLTSSWQKLWIFTTVGDCVYIIMRDYYGFPLQSMTVYLFSICFSFCVHLSKDIMYFHYYGQWPGIFWLGLYLIMKDVMDSHYVGVTLTVSQQFHFLSSIYSPTDDLHRKPFLRLLVTTFPRNQWPQIYFIETSTLTMLLKHFNGYRPRRNFCANGIYIDEKNFQ